MKIKNEAAAHLLAVFTVLIWGTTFISTKVLLVGFSPMQVMFVRMAVAVVALVVIRPRRLRLKSRLHELWFAGAGLFGVTLYFICENTALLLTNASNVSVIVSTTPIFTAISTCYILKEGRLTKGFFAGFVCAIAGISVISFVGSGSLELNPTGDLLALLASMSWAFYPVFLRKINEHGYDAFLVTRRIFFYGLVLLIPALLIEGKHMPFELLLRPEYGLNFLYLGVFASAICYAAWNIAIEGLGAVRASVYIYAIPVVTIVFSMIFLDESLTLPIVVGTVLTLGGLIVSERAGRAK